MNRLQPWAAKAANSLMEDGIITYSVSQLPSDGSRGWVDHTMRKLEDDLGIDFVRVNSGGEIDINYKDELTGQSENPRLLGFAATNGKNYNTYIEVKNYEYYKSTMVHEVGHALGLDHIHEDYFSVMSYERDKGAVDYFSDHDLLALQSVFNPYTTLL